MITSSSTPTPQRWSRPRSTPAAYSPDVEGQATLADYQLRAAADVESVEDVGPDIEAEPEEPVDPEPDRPTVEVAQMAITPMAEYIPPPDPKYWSG